MWFQCSSGGSSVSAVARGGGWFRCFIILNGCRWLRVVQGSHAFQGVGGAKALSRKVWVDHKGVKGLKVSGFFRGCHGTSGGYRGSGGSGVHGVVGDSCDSGVSSVSGGSGWSIGGSWGSRGL